MATHCSHCGAPLPPHAVACRECGSDAETGWNRDVEYLSVELPEDSETADRRASRERNRDARRRTIAVLCVFGLLGGVIAGLAGYHTLWKTLLVIALGLPLALSARRIPPED